jgi:hypothetical protein
MSVDYIICARQMVVATRAHLVSERDLVTQSMNMRPCVGIHLVHRLSAKFQKRRAIPIGFVQLVHAECLRLSCKHTSQLSETQSVTPVMCNSSVDLQPERRKNKFEEPYESIGFMIILKFIRKTRRAARNAGSNYRQRQFVRELDILEYQFRNHAIQIHQRSSLEIIELAMRHESCSYLIWELIPKGKACPQIR